MFEAMDWDCLLMLDLIVTYDTEESTRRSSEECKQSSVRIRSDTLCSSSKQIKEEEEAWWCSKRRFM